MEGKTDGPLTESEIRQWIADGKLIADAYACALHSQEWNRLPEMEPFQDLLELASESESTSPPPPPDSETASASARGSNSEMPSSPSQATALQTESITSDAGRDATNPQAPGKVASWNPLAILLLGILFWPVWSGVMAVLNARRLGMNQPLWRPLAIGVGATMLGIVVGCSGFEMNPFVDELIWTGIPLLALWIFDLGPQSERHEELGNHQTAQWMIPLALGAPLGLLTFLGWLLIIFMPLDGREVVQRFLNSPTPSEAREYVTTNMYPLLDDLAELERLDPENEIDDRFHFEMLDSDYLEDSDYRYVVGYRMHVEATVNEPPTTIEGAFLLIWTDDRWKIDDWLVTTINREDAPGGAVPMSLIIKKLVEEERAKPRSTPSSFSFTSYFKHFRVPHVRVLLVIGAGLLAMFGALRKKIERWIG